MASCRWSGAPSTAFALVLITLAQGVGWPSPRGGAQALAKALGSLLRALGGEICTGQTVTHIDELPRARALLFDLTPRQLLRLAGERLPQRYLQALGRYRYGPGVFKLDYALAAPIPWAAPDCQRAGTLHLGGSLAEIAAALRPLWRGRVSEHPFVLLGQQSLFDDARAPAGRHTAWAYCHVPHGNTVDMTARVERQIERFAPGFRERVLARHSMNTAQLEQHNANLVGGDIGGGIQDLAQHFRAPAQCAAPLRHACQRHLALLFRHAAGRRRARHVRLPRGARCPALMALRAPRTSGLCPPAPLH